MRQPREAILQVTLEIPAGRFVAVEPEADTPVTVAVNVIEAPTVADGEELTTCVALGILVTVSTSAADVLPAKAPSPSHAAVSV